MARHSTSLPKRMSKIFNKNSSEGLPLGVLIIVSVCLFLCLLLLYFFLAARFYFQGGSLRFSGYQVAYTIYGRSYLTLVSLVGASSISFLAWGKSVVIH